MAAYGLASTITVTRVTAKQHFPSDVIVGSALGWYFGRQVYRAHHDPEFGGAPWGNLLPENTGEKSRNPSYMASPYVPIDSWIYPALERLIALGYMQSNISGCVPGRAWRAPNWWKRPERSFRTVVWKRAKRGKIYRTLTNEFATEVARLDGAANVGARVDSVYIRMTGIFGHSASRRLQLRPNHHQRLWTTLLGRIQ